MEEIYRTVYEGVNRDELSDEEREDLIDLVYERTFSAIRDNNPTVSAFHPIDLQLQPTDRCVQRLAASLAHNNNHHIQWIQLLLDSSLCDQRHMVSLFQYLQESTTLRRVDINLDDVDDEVYESFQSMIRALTNSLSLETLKLGIDEGLLIEDFMVPDVARLIQTTMSLRELEMTWTDNHNIAAAFVSNRTIKVLKLNNWYGDDDIIRGHLLSNYVAQSSLPSLLTELSVAYNSSNLNFSQLAGALSMFLTSAAPSLQTLRVVRMQFDGERMDQFLNSIRYHKTLHKLELKWCCFNDAATRSFIAFWQNVAPTTSIESGNNDTHATPQPQYSITSLYIWGDVRDQDSNVLTASTSDTTNMANVLALSLQGSCSLKHLHWAPSHRSNYKLAQFCNMVSDNASTIRLPSLQLDYFADEGYEALLRFLPKLQHLRAIQYLSYKYGKKQIPEHLLLNMVRTNGSLFRFPNDDDNAKYLISIWDQCPAVKLRIRAYFYRNEQLPQLLMHPRMDGNEDDDDDRHAEHEHTNIETPPSIRLMPLLFAAAQPVTYLAPNYILAGLLKFVDPIGLKIQK